MDDNGVPLDENDNVAVEDVRTLDMWHAARDGTTPCSVPLACLVVVIECDVVVYWCNIIVCTLHAMHPGGLAALKACSWGAERREKVMGRGGEHAHRSLKLRARR